MKLKAKLIVVFLLAIVGLGGLSISTRLVMDKNIQVARSVKNEKLKTVLFIEKVASLGTVLNAGIKTSTNTATEDGIAQADQAKASILDLLQKNPAITKATDLAADMENLVKRVETTYGTGQTLVTAVIDQEFGEIPPATEAFKAASQNLETLLGSLQARATASLEQALDQMVLTSRKGARVSLWLSAALIALNVGLLFFLLAAVVGPIREVVAGLRGIAQGDGDLTQRMPDSRKDEIGELAHWFNLFCDKLHTTIRNITGSAETLRFSSNLLTDLSGVMRQDVSTVEDSAGVVKGDADTITANINSVASAMEETSTNISIIASSAEEMSATIGEIAQNTEKVRTITEKAVSQAGEATDRIQRLGEAVLKIGKVTETITQISDQTNLLALNATIEAARAGEAGKGFAVVANEIKALALETASATREIGAQIQEIQQTASGSVEEVTAISDVVHDVNNLVGTIAASIEEQSAVTREIASSVAHASEGINEVNNAMASSAQGVERVTGQVSGIHHATAELAYRSSQTNLSAEDLASIARQVDTLVNQFKLRKAKFDMGAVKGAHLNWRYKLHAVLGGHDKLKPETVSSHHECAFGHWLSSPEGQSLRDDPAFQAVCEAHEKVHQVAHEIASLSQRGLGEKLGAHIETFEETRRHFFTALDELYQ